MKCTYCEQNAVCCCNLYTLPWTLEQCCTTLQRCHTASLHLPTHLPCFFGRGRGVGRSAIAALPSAPRGFHQSILTDFRTVMLGAEEDQELPWDEAGVGLGWEGWASPEAAGTPCPTTPSPVPLPAIPTAAPARLLKRLQAAPASISMTRPGLL